MLSVEDGLLSRNANYFYEDSKGFMWIASEFGLNRFDAYRFEEYTKENGRLIANSIYQVAESEPGMIWLLSVDPDNNNERFIQVLNGTSGSISDLEHHTKTSTPFNEREVLNIKSHHTRQSVLVITKTNAVFSYSPETGWEKIFKAAEQIVTTRISESGLWVFFKNSAHLIDYSGKLIKKIKNDILFQFSELFADNNGNVYYRAPTDWSDGAFVLHKNETPIGRQGDARYWSGFRIAGLDPVKEQIWVYASRPQNDNSQAREVHIDLYDLNFNLLGQVIAGDEFFGTPHLLSFDSQGRGWNNHEQKVNIVSIDKALFTNYLTDISVFGIEGYGARGIYANKEHMYANGLGPSVKLDLRTGDWQEFGPPGGFYPDLRVDLQKLKRQALVKDKRGNFWYTDEGWRLSKYDSIRGEFTNFTYQSQQDNAPLEFERESMAVFWSAFVDERERVWIGRLRGLAYLDKEASFIKSFENYGDREELRNASVFAFAENSDGLWVGAQTGLYQLDSNGNILKRYHNKGSKGSSIPFNTIAHIRSEENTLWLSTKGGGIIKLDTRTSDYEQWTTDSGLSDNVVYATFQDEFGNIWASSNQGIMQIDAESKQVNSFGKTDGLMHEEFNTGSHFQRNDGQIFFGSIDGVTTFHPKDFVTYDLSFAKITPVSLSKQSKRSGIYENFDSQLNEDRIRIMPGELGLSMDFSLLDFMDAESNSYSYKVSPLDADWNYSNSPTVRINSLPYGVYELIIRGQASKGRWSESLTIPIQVVRPFYLKWWFFLLVAILLICSIYYSVKARLNRLEQAKANLEKEVSIRTETISAQAEELKKMDKLKSRFFANVSHELRTPLTLILGPVSGLLKSNDLKDEFKEELLRIERNGQSMSNLVEEILDLSKLEANQLKVSEQSTRVEEYFRIVFGNFLSQARYRDMDYQFNYTGTPDLSILLDQRITERIVNNLLSNAFKFTPNEGNVYLEVIEEQTTLKIKVGDSGSGISNADIPHIFERYFQTKSTSKPVEGGTGIGLAMSLELAHLLDGTLTVESTLHHGSVFTLTIPKKLTVIKVDVEEKEDIPIQEPEETLRPVDLGQSRLLIVEDNYDMQRYLQKVLEEFHGIALADNGKAALDKINTGNVPDIIISDMMMPEMDGLEFLKRVRKLPVTSDTPLLMLTARSAEEDKLEAFSLGVDDYLLKPFSVEELKARLKNLIRNAEFRKEAVNNNAVQLSQNDHNNDKELLKSIERLTRKGVHKIDFNIASVANDIGMSERQLQRKIKSTTGYTPQVFVKEVRLQMARQYLERRNYSQVRDVALAVGFSSSPYFSRLYKERFGKLPKAYFAEHQN